jgi:hypothetical protein
MTGAHIDKAGLELEIGFGDFEHLAASLFAFSAMVEICRDDWICRQRANAKIADESGSVATFPCGEHRRGWAIWRV